VSPDPVTGTAWFIVAFLLAWFFGALARWAEGAA
jgi:hypothetical protein